MKILQLQHLFSGYKNSIFLDQVYILLRTDTVEVRIMLATCISVACGIRRHTEVHVALILLFATISLILTVCKLLSPFIELLMCLYNLLQFFFFNTNMI